MLSAPVYAYNKSDFYDFGPYYNQPQVLGLSLSSLENLPVPEIPAEIVPPSAAGIMPGNVFYPLEQGIENIQLAFSFDPVKKEELRLQFAHERLSEAKTLMNQGKIDAANQAINNYNQNISSITQTLSTLAQEDDSAAKALAQKVEETLTSQAVFTQSVILSSPPAQAENWTAALNTNTKALDEATHIQGVPPIPEELSNSIQKLKDQGLFSEEESNKLYSLSSRGQVRDELERLTSSGQFPPSELIKLDTSIETKYPEVHKTMAANLQIAELRTYQTLPQPSKEIVREMEKWERDPTQTPPNSIKPYLWYNRAQDLATDVDLTNFPTEQQVEVAKFYSEAIEDNPTYSPPPIPSPSATPSQTITESDTPDQSPLPSPSPTTLPTPPSANPYLTETGGVLPDHPLYFIKRFGEEFSTALTFDPTQKAALIIQYADRRLAEAAALTNDPQKASFLASTLENYQSSIDMAANYLKNAGDDTQAKELAKKFESQASRHEVVLEKGLIPVTDPKLISEAIQATENAMDISADILDRPALPPVLASRLDDLKAQGLILPEEVNDLVNSNSRTEVREKVRKLTELGTFPLADAKKLDEAQTLAVPSDYNQLTEVRKVEELQNLRSVQSELAQTPTLKSNLTTLSQNEAILTGSIDTSLIKPEDLGNRETLVKAYEKLSAIPRPINGGQFGSEATPGAQPKKTSPTRQDAVLTTCPEGAVFKQFEGCVWADSGKSLNDYDQYKCEGPRQYYSFAVKKCVAYDATQGWNNEDAQPICPVGYTWNWQTQSCQTSTGGIFPWPSPSPQPEPIDDQEREERAKSCPEGASYQPPNGCVWDKNGKSVYDPEQYRCGRAQYYSFEEEKCVASPKEGEPYPKNTSPVCKEEGAYWNWTEGKCILAQKQPETPGIIIDDFRPPFIAPNSPLYIVKQAAERIQLTLALTAPAREQVSLAQAKERLVEAADALRRNDQDGFKKSLTTYTSMMQNIVADVSKESLSEGAKKKIGERLGEESATQNLLLERLSAWAPEEHNNTISTAINTTILGVDKAADISGEPPIPDEIRSKIEALPAEMISEEGKQKLLEMNSRVEARLNLGDLVNSGVLTSTDTAFLNEDFGKVDQNAKIKVDELKKLEQIATITENKEKFEEKVKKNEEVVQKLQEFEKTFEPGQDVPAEIRPFVRLTRIDEAAQTVRPDIVNLADFQNRKDVVLAVATLQEEFKPTKEAMKKVEDFRRNNPNAPLPPELARVEALSYSLGVRGQAGPCYLPSPPFAPNTPCPAPGAAIPIASYATNYTTPGFPGASTSPYADYGTATPSVDKEGKPLVYGQGPKPESPGVCPSGSHWMYDSGGWCMADSGSYGSSYSYTPTGTGPGYTPYSPYYTAPGAPPATYGYPGGNSYPSSGYPYSYSPPSYYGPAPTYYTTNPPSGTVPGSGPRPTAPGQCPSGFHWMSDSGGWCMANGPTYVPSGTTTSETPPGGGGYFPGSSYQYGCTPGYYWDGSKCTAGSYEGSGWSDTAARTQSWCQPPSGGCGSNSYWDYGSCYCRSSSTYGGGGGPSPSNQCQGLSCGGGAWLDYSTCSCKYSGGSGTTPTGTTITCYPPSAGCPGGWYDYGTCSCKSSSTPGGNLYNPVNPAYGCQPPSGGCGSGWFDYGSCSCKQSSSQGCYNVSASSCGSGWYFDSAACTCRQSTTSSGGSSSGSCPAGSHWMSDNGGYCMSDTPSTPSSGSTSTTSGGSSSGSCPSGYHWMSDNGGWCMADGGGSSPSTTTSTPSTDTSTSTSTSQPAPAPEQSTTTTTTQSAPAPSEPAPAPAP